MNTDCAFYIGTTHEVCQDYALSGGHSVSVSDGCSGSVLSDFGSRIIAATAMNKIAEIKSLRDFNEEEVILLARPSVKSLDLPVECLDATLLCASKNGDITEAICYGDGVVAVRMESGEIFVISIEYIDSYPFYINYLFDKTGRYKNWVDNHNKRQIKLSVIKNDGSVEVINDDCDKDTRIKYGVKEIGLIKYGHISTLVDIIDTGVESLTILSDGTQSFYKTIISGTSKYNEKIDYHKILAEALSFKNYTGKFVQRRMNKFIKMCNDNQWSHSDDFGIATIYLGE